MQAAEQLALAQQSLGQLTMYTDLEHQTGDWSVQMHQNPMPAPPGMKARPIPEPR